jgi:hypothetical protein
MNIIFDAVGGNFPDHGGDFCIDNCFCLFRPGVVALGPQRTNEKYRIDEIIFCHVKRIRLLAKDKKEAISKQAFVLVGPVQMRWFEPGMPGNRLFFSKSGDWKSRGKREKPALIVRFFELY